MKPRTPLFAAGAGLAAAALALWFLYGIGGRDVHADRQAPPAILDKWELTSDRPLVPEAQFFDEAGETVRLTDFRGRWVLLNLWATWCAPCVTELPALARAREALPADRIAVIAVDLERLEAERVSAFLREHDAAALPVLIDRELTMMRGFGAFGLPLTILIDPDGHEFARAVGPQEWGHNDAIAYLRAISTSSDPTR